MFKTLVMKGDKWFSTGKQLVLMLKMMILHGKTYVSPLSTQMSPNIVREEKVDDVHANRNDHDE